MSAWIWSSVKFTVAVGPSFSLSCGRAPEAVSVLPCPAPPAAAWFPCPRCREGTEAPRGPRSAGWTGKGVPAAAAQLFSGPLPLFQVLAAVRRTRGGALSPSLSLSPSPGTACRGRCSLGSGVLPPFSCWTPAEESASPSPELPTRSGPTSEKTAEETQKRRLNEILTIITCLFNNSTPQSRLLAGTFRWNH